MSSISSPYAGLVVSWNITRRCNLECEHCYIDALMAREAPDGELSTEECFKVVDQLAERCPEALLILTGGEPLLRRDVFEIASYANAKKFWVVVGTNGVLIDDRVVEKMKASGVRGVSLSLDALDPARHDAFRGIRGAWNNTVRGAEILRAHGLPFLIQTTLHKDNLHEVEALAEKAFQLGARVFNLYFLVSTGRGAFVSNVSPQQYEDAMRRLIPLQKQFTGKMLINSKCAPHYQRVLYETDPQSPFLKTFSMGAGGCPAGTHYVGIRPTGEVTPCPYLPVYGGNLRQQSFSDIWEKSEVFVRIRERKKLGGRCGPCEFNEVCGGCRARAFGETGDYMAEDPWCVYEPGKFGGRSINFETTYGADAVSAVSWSPEARERLQRVPAFVRGMVTKSVEKKAREEGLVVVTAELMDRLRSQVMGRVLGVPSFQKKEPSSEKKV